jgi:hypothetical protein
MFAGRNMTFARPVAGGGGFDPLSLSPSLWLDASDSSTLYDAVTGGSLVAADGLVARWEDKSGNARHATQATSGSRATRKTSQINSKDVLRFDGGDFFGFSGLSAAATTSFFVWRTSNLGAYNNLISSNSHAFYSAATPYMQFYDGGFRAISTIPVVVNTALISTLRIGGASGPIEIFKNNTLAGSESLSVATQNFNQIAAFLSSYTLVGDIAEILIYPTALSTTNRQDVESWLNTKYAIY